MASKGITVAVRANWTRTDCSAGWADVLWTATVTYSMANSRGRSDFDRLGEAAEEDYGRLGYFEATPMRSLGQKSVEVSFVAPGDLIPAHRGLFEAARAEAWARHEAAMDRYAKAIGR